jgi:hypothetical protein
MAEPVMRSSLPRIEVNLEEIYQILDAARRQPMSETDYAKVKSAVAALAEKRSHRRGPRKRRERCPQSEPE